MTINQQVILDLIKVVNSNDIEKVMEFFAPDCFYHNTPLNPVTGAEAIRGILEGFNSTADEVEWTVHNIGQTEEGHVMTERTDAFRFGEKWVRLPVMGIFEINRGKITSWRDYFDANQMEQMMAKL